jgi:hypothetical protein
MMIDVPGMGGPIAVRHGPGGEALPIDRDVDAIVEALLGVDPLDANLVLLRGSALA